MSGDTEASGLGRDEVLRLLQDGRQSYSVQEGEVEKKGGGACLSLS